MRNKLRKKPQQKSFGPGSYTGDYPDDLSASINYHVRDALKNISYYILHMCIKVIFFL